MKHTVLFAIFFSLFVGLAASAFATPATDLILGVLPYDRPATTKTRKAPRAPTALDNAFRKRMRAMEQTGELPR